MKPNKRRRQAVNQFFQRIHFINAGVALLIGFASAVLCYLARTYYMHPGAGDFGYSLRLAQDVLAGGDPYNHPVTPLSVPYPLTAAFIALPLVWLPVPLSSAVFSGISSAFLAYGLLQSGPKWRLLIFISPLYLNSLAFAQWPPLIMAMAFFPSLLFLIVIKPHIALPLALSGFVRWTKRGVGLTIALGLLSLVIIPSWPFRWFPQLSLYEGLVPPLFTLPFGPLLLLSLVKWRSKEGRLLSLMAAVPQRMFYDQLPLLLIPQTFRYFFLLILLSWVGFLAELSGYAWQTLNILFIYLPMMLVMFIEGRGRSKDTPFDVSPAAT